MPGTAISVDQVNSNVVLSGTVADAGQAEKAKVLAAALAGEVKGAQVVNRLSVATPNQVDLHVRIAEVDRNILKQIGVDWSKLGSGVKFTTTNNSATPTLFGGAIPRRRQIFSLLVYFHRFLEMRSLSLCRRSRPKVSHRPCRAQSYRGSGQTASFLAGGEFPYEVAQSGSAGNTTGIHDEFKQFGVQLAFTPTMIDANHLNLRVRPEVSQLDFADGVPLNGAVVPALTVRSAETTVELASGQSFALAGLLMHDTSQDISKVPLLGDIPVLGALFRSNKFQNNETELVVIITPYLVRPPTATPATPVDGFAIPHDAQQVLWAIPGGGACRRRREDRSMPAAMA